MDHLTRTAAACWVKPLHVLVLLSEPNITPSWGAGSGK